MVIWLQQGEIFESPLHLSPVIESLENLPKPLKCSFEYAHQAWIK